jgi:hypothetical protein
MPVYGIDGHKFRPSWGRGPQIDHRGDIFRPDPALH